MSREKLKELWYYIIRTDDGDRYYREVYASDELIHISTTEKEAEEYLSKLVQFIEK